MADSAPDDRRIAWIAPDGSIAQVSSPFSGTGTDRYTIPSDPSDRFAQVGTWAVATIDGSGVGFAHAIFVVRDPNRASVDLSVNSFGAFETSAGNVVNYRIELTNNGPDDAASVELRNPVPGSTTFVSQSQETGPAFTCTTPPSGSNSGTIHCTATSMPANSTAVLTLSFSVDAGVANGSIISNAVSVTSATNELHQPSNSASSSSTVVSATAAPCSISCPSVAPVSTSDCSAVVTYPAPTIAGNCDTDPEGGSGIVCSPESGSRFPIGSTVVTCTSPGGDTCNFTVTVNYTGPTGGVAITCPANITVATELSGGTAQVNYPTPTTAGNCVTISCVPPSGSIFPSGITTVTCTATDPANNVATCSFTVNVNDGTGGNCTLTCPSDVTVSAAANECSAVATFPEHTADGECGTVTCKDQNGVVRHSGDTFPVGATVITCTSSNGGADCQFTVTVIGAAAPVITTCASEKSVLVGANCEGAIPNLLSEVVATGCNVTLTQSPAAGSLVPPGVYTVTITAENSAGEATCTAIVRVVDNTAPVIIACPPATSANAGSSCQVPVPNVIPSLAVADDCTPPEALTITQSPAAGTLVGAGTTTITVTVRDESGNTRTCTTTFTVTDTTPPTITCPANIVVNLPLNSTAVSMPVNFSVAASDNCAGVTVASSPASGSTFPVGTTTVTATATDAAGLTATCSFTVTVRYNFAGFFSPVGNPPALNTVNAGRAIPVKFSLSGNKGLNIFVAGFPASGVINCDASAPPNEVTETLTAGNSSLTYDASSDQYIYVWKTESSWAGTCRQLVIKLNDGSTHVANFKFR